MVHQTTQLNGAARLENGPLRGAVHGVGAVLATSIDLASLQLRLAKSDAQKAASRLKPVVVAAVFAVGMVVSSLPLLGMGLASVLSAMTTLAVWQSQLIVSGFFLIAAIMLAVYCWSAVKRLGAVFDRSLQAGHQNILWLRRAVEQISR